MTAFPSMQFRLPRQVPPQAPRPASLLDWPQQVPAPVAQCLADAHMVLTMEQGPAEWWQGWQKERLHELMTWLCQDDAWRQWFGAAAFPEAALSRLPIMRRADYRRVAARPARVPASHGRVMPHSTSGSSGAPVRFQYSQLAGRLNNHMYWADHQRQGRDLRKQVMSLSGTPDEHAGAQVEIPGNPWLHPAPQVARHSPSFTVDENARWLCTQSPAYLATHPTLLSGMLSVIERDGLTAPRIEQIMTFSESVDAQLRERCRRIFGATVKDRYSCEELGPLAFQCPHSDDHYHVAVSNVILEVVDDNGLPRPPGEPGTVLATALHQWAHAAVRYDVGDIAAMLPHCPVCGVQVPTLTRLLGRKRTLVQSPDGTLSYVRVLGKDWLACAPVREHRLVQTSLRSFRVELVLERPMTPQEQEATQAMLRKIVGDAFSFELQQLDAIPWPPGRKRQEVVGLAAQEHAG
ncbi:hypothetical protein ACO2Q9_15750 [Variovorax sp. VNK109]|uniref:hypothetical protein n=1 Tax=Variovorax sp. VNK109 TaxID=3400919 RepID=UPI003BFB6249